MLVLLGVVLAVVGLSREPSTLRRRVLLLLRLLARAMALFFLLEPGLRRMARVRVKNRVAVLIATAPAKPPPAPGPHPGQRRRRALQRFAPGGTASSGFRGWGSRAGDVAEALGAPGSGNRTDLMAALRSLKATDTGGSRKLAGAILLSDGADNAELQGGLTPRLTEELRGLGFPVSTVRVGEPALVDLAVENVKVDDFAFVRNAVTVDLELHGRGLKGPTSVVLSGREAVGTPPCLDSGTTENALLTLPRPDRRFVYTVGARCRSRQ